jgi:Flp pilus assembly protein TadG
VEFALLLPAIVLVIVALAEVVTVARTQYELMNAAREGARVAATVPDPDAAVDRTRSALGSTLAAGTIVSVRRPAVVGAEASVEVSYTHHVVGYLLGGAPLELRSRAVMRVEK